jgi:hypothetical protein
MFDEWWLSETTNHPNKQFGKGYAYWCWCAALGFDLRKGGALEKREGDSPVTADPEAAAFERWWQERTLIDYETTKRLVYRAWCASAAQPPRVAFPTEFPLGSEGPSSMTQPASGLPVQPEPINTAKNDFEEWWDEATRGSPGTVELVDRMAYRAWCAALGFDVEGETLVKRGGRSTSGSDPEAPDFDHWWTQMAERDPLGDKKSLAYRAWCAGAATGTVTPKLDNLEMLYRIAREQGWCAEAPASGLPVQPESVRERMSLPPLETTRRFDEWWEAFREKEVRPNFTSMYFAWYAWCAAHKKMGASMANDNLPSKPAWLCQCGTAYEGARSKVRMDLAPDRLAKSGIDVWICQCGLVYEGDKPRVCDPARTRFEAQSRGLNS